MKDMAASIVCMLIASVGATYLIREINTDFWRTKAFYANAKRNMDKKFKFSKA